MQLDQNQFIEALKHLFGLSTTQIAVIVVLLFILTFGLLPIYRAGIPERQRQKARKKERIKKEEAEEKAQTKKEEEKRQAATRKMEAREERRRADIREVDAKQRKVEAQIRESESAGEDVTKLLKELEALAASRELLRSDEELAAALKASRQTDDELRALRGEPPEEEPPPKPLEQWQMHCVNKAEAAGWNLETTFLEVLKEWEEEGTVDRLGELDSYIESMDVLVFEAWELRIPDDDIEYTIKNLRENSYRLVQEFKDLLEEPTHKQAIKEPQWNTLLHSYKPEKGKIAKSFKDKIKAHKEDLVRLRWAYDDIGKKKG